MRRADVAHVLRAAQEITKQREFILVGSQAPHLQLNRMPPEMLMSGELDIYPLHKPELSELIDAALGEGSMFHRTHGYYAHGVSPETSKLPAEWFDRSVRISNRQMNNAVAIAPEIHDICASKAFAGRDKDYTYVDAAITTKLVDPILLKDRIEMIEGAPSDLLKVASSWAASRIKVRGRGR